jgi:hypothetical protein
MTEITLQRSPGSTRAARMQLVITLSRVAEGKEVSKVLNCRFLCGGQTSDPTQLSAVNVSDDVKHFSIGVSSLMTLIFRKLLDLVKVVHVDTGNIGSNEFLAICLQIIPVIGNSL